MAGDHDSERNARWNGWMAAAQDGDQQAYARLLRDVLPFLRAIVARQHRSYGQSGADRIEDVVQDVLLTVHRVRHTYDPARPFAHWLATIAQRRSIDALRRRGRGAAHEVWDEKAYETFADPLANKPEEARDAAQAIRPALAALPPGQREAIELVKLRELSLEEASTLSGKSVAALKVNVHRALKTLRARLGGNGLKGDR